MATTETTATRSGQKRTSVGVSTMLLPGLLICGMAGAGCGIIDSITGGEATASDDQKLTIAVQRGVIQVSVTEDGEVESAKPVILKCMVAGGAQILEIVPDGTRIVEKGGVKTEESDVFVGDQIVKLDDSKIKDSLDQQKIKVGNAETAMILADKDLSLAKITVNEYEQGTFIQELQGLDAEVTIAMENLRGAENQFDYTKKMFRKGFVTKLQLEADEFAVKRSKLELGQSQTKRVVLVKFTKVKMLQDLRSAVKTATQGVKQKQSALDLELRLLERITKQFKNCVILAPQPGMVVYHNERSRWGRSQTAQIEEGATVREHQAIVKLPDFTKMQVKVNVHESKVQQVAVGDRAWLTIQGYKTALKGVVIEIANQPETASWYQAKVKEYATIVKIDEIPAGMVPGMSAEVVIDVEERQDVLKLPVESVIEIGGDYFAWTNGAAGYEKKQLTVAKSGKGDERVLTDSKFIAVEDGVEEREEVVLNPRDVVPEAKELILADEQKQAEQKKTSSIADAKSGSPGAGTPQGGRKKTSGRKSAAKGGGGGAAQGGLGRMAQFDKDKDGKISKAESEGTYLANFFDRVDGDKDGFVTASEVAAMQSQGKGKKSREGSGGSGKKSAGGGGKKAAGGGGGFTGANLLTRWDKDSDGKVSKDEIPEQMQAGFDALDGDSDGFLDRAELDKMVAAMRARAADGGGGGQ